MLLSAVLVAASVQAAPAEPSRAVEARVIPPARHQGCPRGETTFVLEPKAAPPARPLAKARPHRASYAVMRSIDGCPVDAPMSVSGAR
ncbi:hypothetical protein SGCZBJ_00245 [Caulobacter zeae]|uniref:Uncharacterized protein n=1 Tax=Caulobacter zeae TaxID=2055137 RepID=A0A2N5DS72_9CAUL|nr:hypothetical protein [Caulobacter zeae]PLR28907.1 hypothetical protein SGCZBJ_00245 [Caulobacter zeae]